MGRAVSRIAGVIAIIFSLATAASAQTIMIDEARFGGTWAQPEWLDHGHREDDQFGVNAEILLSPFNWDMRAAPEDDFLHALATPRLHIGGMLNFDDDGTDYVYSGLTWQFGITEMIFIEGGFGLALNNGSEVTTATRAGLGSDITFRESIALGFNLTEAATLVFQLEHLSHAELFDDRFNRGLSNASVRVGMKF